VRRWDEPMHYPPRYKVDAAQSRVYTYADDAAFARRRDTVRWLIRHWITLTIVTAICAAAVTGGLVLM
jgi:hypothetical protein